MYFYAGQWLVASHRRPDAAGTLDSDELGPSLADLFWQTFQTAGLPLPPPTATGLCFQWELCLASRSPFLNFQVL